MKAQFDHFDTLFRVKEEEDEAVSHALSEGPELFNSQQFLSPDNSIETSDKQHKK